MFEKMKMVNLKTDIITTLRRDLKFEFEKELEQFKTKCEKLVALSYSNSRQHIENLKKEIEFKDITINHLLTSLTNLTKDIKLNNSTPDSAISNSSYPVNKNQTSLNVSVISDENDNENEPIIEVNNNEVNNNEVRNNETSKPSSSSNDTEKIIEDEDQKKKEMENRFVKKIVEIRKEKHQQYIAAINNANAQTSDEKEECNSEVKPDKCEKPWPEGTCAIVGDSIITGIEEKRLGNKNGLVKVRDFRGATIGDLKHHIIPIIRKKPDYLILHIGTNDAVNRTSREILDDILQLKNTITKELPRCKVILSRPTIRKDNGKAALTLKHLNEHISQLETESIDNSNIKETHLGKKGLHLNLREKRDLP